MLIWYTCNSTWDDNFSPLWMSHDGRDKDIAILYFKGMKTNFFLQGSKSKFINILHGLKT